MANKIQLRRGAKSKLPTLDIGEPAFTTDTKELYIGASGGNVAIGGNSDVYTTTGSGSAYVLTLPAYALQSGRLIMVKFHTANTTASPTLNANGTGAKTLRRNNNSLVIGEIYAGQYGLVAYDGSYYQVFGMEDISTSLRMLGYSKGSSRAAIATSDTLSVAIGKLEYGKADYIEGTWTPTGAMVASTSHVTYGDFSLHTTVTGYETATWTKIGRVVHVLAKNIKMTRYTSPTISTSYTDNGFALSGWPYYPAAPTDAALVKVWNSSLWPDARFSSSPQKLQLSYNSSVTLATQVTVSLQAIYQI